MRDWKHISATAMDQDQVLLENPDFNLTDQEDFPGVVIGVGGPEATFPPTEFSARTVRTFLWENRKSRAVVRDRAVLQIDRSDDDVRVSLAALTHPDAASRLEDHG